MTATMTFNDWRHSHTKYDRRMDAARTLEQQRAIMEQTALEGMQLAYAQRNVKLAQQIMGWAKSKGLLN